MIGILIALSKLLVTQQVIASFYTKHLLLYA